MIPFTNTTMLHGNATVAKKSEAVVGEEIKEETPKGTVAIRGVRMPIELLGLYLNINKSIRTYKGSHLLQLDQELGGSFGAFRCCGARAMSDFYQRQSLTEQEKQNFVAFFLNTKGEYLTWYYILAGYQLKATIDKYEVALLFEELGAEELDARPNRLHGPEDMHLKVWSPLNNTEKIEKFCKRIPATRRGGAFDSVMYQWEPLWWLEMTDEERKKYIADHEADITLGKAAIAKNREDDQKQLDNNNYWITYRYIQYQPAEMLTKLIKELTYYDPGSIAKLKGALK